MWHIAVLAMEVASMTIKKLQGHVPAGFPNVSSRAWGQRSEAVWPVAAKVLTGALLALALILASLGSTWAGGQAAASPTSSVVGGRVPLPEVSRMAASPQATGPVGIVVKLAKGPI